MSTQRKATQIFEKGKVHHQNGRLKEAVIAYRKSLKLNPNLGDARNKLAGIYFAQGKLNESYEQYIKLLKLGPRHAPTLNNIGCVLQHQGKHDEATEWFRRAIRENSQFVEAMHNLATSLWQVGEDSAAVSRLRDAIRIAPDRMEGYLNLGAFLTSLDQTEEAVACFQRALRIIPDNASAYHGLGLAHSSAGNLEAAVDSYRKAIALEGNNPNYYRDLGKLFSEHGMTEEAMTAYRQALAIKPEFALAYQGISAIKRFTERDQDIRAMEALFAERKASGEDSIHLAFSLGKAYEDLGDYDRSFDYVSKATRLRRRTFEYSPEEAQEKFDRISTIFSEEFLASHSNSGYDDTTPIFILGMPRSGTSLVEQILSSHPEVYGGGERYDLPLVFESTKGPVGRFIRDTFPDGIDEISADDLARLGRQYVARIRQRAERESLVTDKMPHNFLRIGLIRLILPRARIIHCSRDPMDCCFSIFKTDLLKGHRYSYDMVELGHYYKGYQALMNHWRKTLPGAIYEISYEAVVNDLESQVRQLLEYCGLPWHDGCLEFYKTRRKVDTASKAQINRPIYADSIGLWKRYERHLEPLRLALS